MRDLNPIDKAKIAEYTSDMARVLRENVTDHNARLKIAQAISDYFSDFMQEFVQDDFIAEVMKEEVKYAVQYHSHDEIEDDFSVYDWNEHDTLITAEEEFRSTLSERDPFCKKVVLVKQIILAERDSEPETEEQETTT